LGFDLGTGQGRNTPGPRLKELPNATISRGEVQRLQPRETFAGKAELKTWDYGDGRQQRKQPWVGAN